MRTSWSRVTPSHAHADRGDAAGGVGRHRRRRRPLRYGSESRKVHLRPTSRDSQVAAVLIELAPASRLAAVAQSLDSGALPEMTAVPPGEATSSTGRPSINRVWTSDLPVGAWLASSQLTLIRSP